MTAYLSVKQYSSAFKETLSKQSQFGYVLISCEYKLNKSLDKAVCLLLGSLNYRQD